MSEQTSLRTVSTSASKMTRRYVAGHTIGSIKDETLCLLCRESLMPATITPLKKPKQASRNLTQEIDIAEVILSRIRRPHVVHTLCRPRKSRCELLSTSEAHWFTTKSDGMCNFRVRLTPWQPMI